MPLTCSTLLRLTAAVMMVVPSPAFAYPWSLRAIVQAPAVVDVAISPNGHLVAYVIRRMRLTDNALHFELHLLSMQDRRDRVVARSSWMNMLRSVPGQTAWSVLADFGKGVQLYRFAPSGRKTPVVINPRTVYVGSADGALDGGASDPPLRIGVLAYDWSPNGTALFYTTLTASAGRASPLTDQAVITASARHRWSPEGLVHLFVRDAKGRKHPLVARPATDVIARHLALQLRS